MTFHWVWHKPTVCMGPNVSMQFRSVGDNGIAIEHLHLSCSTCGFEFLMAPKEDN